MKDAIPSPGTAPLWHHSPGAGNTHAADYAHFRKANDVYSDVVYGRPATRVAPAIVNEAHIPAAGLPGIKDGYSTIMPEPIAPPLPGSVKDQAGQFQPRWPSARSAPGK